MRLACRKAICRWLSSTSYKYTISPYFKDIHFKTHDRIHLQCDSQNLLCPAIHAFTSCCIVFYPYTCFILALYFFAFTSLLLNRKEGLARGYISYRSALIARITARVNFRVICVFCGAYPVVSIVSMWHCVFLDGSVNVWSWSARIAWVGVVRIRVCLWEGRGGESG